MKSAQFITLAMFGALVFSGVMMYRSGGFKPKQPEREVLTNWPQEVLKAFEAYDLDKLDNFFVDDFVDQENTPKQSYKAILALERQHQQSMRWKAVLKSTQVEWDPAIPLEAQLQIQFDLHKFGEPKAMEVELKMKKIDDEWKGVSAVVKRSVIGIGVPTTLPTEPDSKSELPK